MKIGINAYEAVVPRFGYDRESGLPNRVGSGEFCFRLLSAIFAIDKKNEYLVYLPVAPTEDMPKPTSNWRYEIFSAKLWTLLGLSRKLLGNSEKLKVFFSPTHYLPIYSPVPSVISILDVSYLHFPQLFKKRDLYQLGIWGKLSIGRAKKVITISNSSKNDIIKAYGVSPEKVAVVYPGVRKMDKVNKVTSKEEFRKKHGLGKEYILFVGTLQPRKNIVRLIEAFSKIKNKDLELVIVGRKGWMYEEIMSAPERLGVLDRVKFLHSIGDEELPNFYRHALCFVLPSLYEGFGLPVLEAMQYDCPVITSKVSSLPEAGGDAAMYFDPLDSEDIAEKITTVIFSPKIREEMIKKGQSQVEKFSWENSARETIKILESIGKNIS